MNEIIFLVGLILAAAVGYSSRAIIARLDTIPTDLEQVVIGFNLCDRCEFGEGHDSAAAHLGQALLAAADQRGISRGQLLGFIAACAPIGPSIAAGAIAPAGDRDRAEQQFGPRQIVSIGPWPRKAEVLEAQAC